MAKNLITGNTGSKRGGKFSKYANPTFITKNENLMTGVVKSDFGKTAYYDTEQTIPNFYTPELTPETWLLPRTRAEILRWCRLFFNLDPYINSILTMHAQYPISNFRLSYKDKDTEAFFNRKLFDNKEFSWIDFLEQVMLSYFKMGEAVVWADWSESKGTWNGFSLIDPSLIEYKEDPLSGEVEMSIIPTRELKQMLADGLKQGRTDIPVEYIRCVQENQKIPLDATGTEPNYLTGKKYSPAKVFMLARKTDPGATRGTPITQCARYSTKIKLLDGTTKCIGDLYKDGAKDFWVYSIDDNGNITPKKASKVIYQGKKLTYDITLDNGEVLGFTSDHPFLMRDGSWKEVKDLKPGDSLMPLYTRDKKIGNGMYEQVYSPVNDSWEFTHRLVELQGKFKGCVIHHKNFDKRDNRPENLLVTTFDKHIKLHKYLLEKSKDKRLEGLKKYRNTPKFEENRKKQSLCASVFMKEVWKSEEYREKQKKYTESRKKALLKTMSSSKYKEAMIEGKKKRLDRLYSFDSKYAEIKNLSNGYISVCGGKSTARHYRHMVQFLGLDLGVIAHNGKTYIYNKTVDISKVIEENCVIQSTSSVLNSILKEVSKILSNDDIDYVVLENDKYGINNLSKAKSISRLLKSRFSTIGLSYLSYFGTTVIYKPVAKELIELFRKNNYMLGYDTISKDRATDSIDCNSLLADMLYSQESSIKEIKYTRSILRQLKSYVKRNNLPINISKKGDKIIISRVWNHKVVSVVPAQVEDVYDIENVDGTHVFAVACEDGSGVFVHNCLFKTLIYQDKIKLAQIACASGDTKVKLLDGTVKTMEELYTSKAKDFYVYSCTENGETTFKKASKVICNGKKQLYRINLDNGYYLRFTEDHPFLMRDGSWKEVKDLKPGDSLMPLYTRDKKIGNGMYEQVYSPVNDSWEFTHRLVELQGKFKGCVIHHKNFDKRDNRPENLEAMTFEKHSHMHRELTRRMQPKLQEAVQKYRSSDRYKEDLINNGKEISKARLEQEHNKYKSGVRYKLMTTLPECGYKVINFLDEKQTAKKNFERVSKAFNLGVKVRSFNGKLLIYKESVKNNEDFKKVVNELSHELQYGSAVKNTMSSEFKEFLSKYDDLIKGNIDYIVIETPSEKKLNNVRWSIEVRIRADGYNNFKVSGLRGYGIVIVYNEKVSDLIREIQYDSRVYLKSKKSDVWNHKVVSVEKDSIEDVYDIESVEDTHTFGVVTDDGSGVYLHNCADRLHLPIEIWTIGSYTGDPQTSIIPDDSMIGEVREAIRQATMQPPFSIFVPPYIKYEAVGVNGKLLSVYEDLGYVENCIFVGLGVNKNLILGAGPSFSSSKQTSLFKLIKMYKMLRLKLEAFIKRYILLPIARANDIKDEYGDYVVPNIEWEESLQPEQDVEKFNNVLKLWDKGLVSTTTVYEYFPGKLDINLEKQRLEMERGSIWDKGTDRLGSKAQRSDLNEKKPDTGNKPSMPTPSDGSKPAEGLPPPMGGDVEEGGEPESTEVPEAPEEVPAEQ